MLDLAIIHKAGCDPSLFNTICSSIDKLDKEPWTEVENELQNKGLSAGAINEIHKFVNLKAEDPNVLLDLLRKYFGEASVISEIEILFNNLRAMGIF